jgi:long-chain fatty acid transport protein
MRKSLGVFFVVSFLVFLSSVSFATNGDDLMGIGPISRSMGGVGIADPQDAISAVFANPAAMCFGPFCPGAEVNFGGTLFMPKVNSTITIPGMSISASSARDVYAIPAIGLSVPISDEWRFGLAAYGVSGLGVDYRNTSIDNSQFFNFGPAGNFPLIAGEDTQLQIMKFSPSISFKPSNNFSLGASLQIDYANLDLRSGSSFNYAVGAQAGALFKLVEGLTLGATYISSQEVTYKKVIQLDPSQPAGDLKLAQPQQAGLGLALEPMKDIFLIEADAKWVNWANAAGYDDFDWKNQWVFAFGAQFKPTKQLALRVGYNYANNPVNVHNNFVGFNGTSVPPLTNVQGNIMPTYYYETFRVIGFPAIAKQHATVGIGYELSNRFALNAGYTHAFKETITESGTNIAGQPTTLQSSLSEDSIEFGLTWRF